MHVTITHSVIHFRLNLSYLPHIPLMHARAHTHLYNLFAGIREELSIDLSHLLLKSSSLSLCTLLSPLVWRPWVNHLSWEDPHILHLTGCTPRVSSTCSSHTPTSPQGVILAEAILDRSKIAELLNWLLNIPWKGHSYFKNLNHS